MPVVRLSNPAQTYAWGKLGNESKVAQLAPEASLNASIEPATPYAELWMGTHPNGPSVLFDNPSESLLSFINKNPSETLSESVVEKFKGDLPFLFKILSVRLALSIQAHPDKKLAEKLFKERPNVYKDDNHKPEMAIALTKFEGMCGFRPLRDIAEQFAKFESEMKHVLGGTVYDRLVQLGMKKSKDSVENSKEDRDALKSMLEALLTAPENVMKEQLAAIVAKSKERVLNDPVCDLLVMLNKQFPGDVGCFCALFLNRVCLQPGQAMFLAANEPHAYLSGDCVECMATSDNVVRAGLTPKLKDVDTLVNMLTYNSFTPEQIIQSGHPTLNHSISYPSPVPEFSVLRTELSANQREQMAAMNVPSILIVTSGEGNLKQQDTNELLKLGRVYFIGAKDAIELSTTSSLQVFRAFSQ